MSPQERRPFDQTAAAVEAAIARGHYPASFRVPTTCAECGRDYPCTPDLEQRRYDRQQIGLAVTVLVLLIIVPVVLAWRVLTG